MTQFIHQTHRTVLRNGKTVGYYYDTFPNVEEDYVSISMPACDPYQIVEAYRRGYILSDRGFEISIALKNFKSMIRPGKRFSVALTDDWESEEIYNIAKGSFSTDRRFALDLLQKDTELKNELLYDYIRELKKQGVHATCLYRDEDLEGFNLWGMDNDAGRIMLGGVSSRYQNTGVALSLYSGTMEAIRSQAPSNSAVVCDEIGSSNTASLNLHAMLARFAGGEFRFGNCTDYYRKGPRDGVNSGYGV